MRYRTFVVIFSVIILLYYYYYGISTLDNITPPSNEYSLVSPNIIYDVFQTDPCSYETCGKEYTIKKTCVDALSNYEVDDSLCDHRRPVFSETSKICESCEDMIKSENEMVTLYLQDKDSIRPTYNTTPTDFTKIEIYKNQKYTAALHRDILMYDEDTRENHVWTSIDIKPTHPKILGYFPNLEEIRAPSSSRTLVAMSFRASDGVVYTSNKFVNSATNISQTTTNIPTVFVPPPNRENPANLERVTLYLQDDQKTYNTVPTAYTKIEIFKNPKIVSIIENDPNNKTRHTLIYGLNKGVPANFLERKSVTSLEETDRVILGYFPDYTETNIYGVLVGFVVFMSIPGLDFGSYYATYNVLSKT